MAGYTAFAAWRDAAFVRAVNAVDPRETLRLLRLSASPNTDICQQYAPSRYAARLPFRLLPEHLRPRTCQEGAPVLATVVSWEHFGFGPVVRELIGRGADLNRRDTLGRTALVNAAWARDAETVTLLLGAGADRCAASRGWDALFAAAATDSLPVARALLTHGTNPDGCRDYGGTPLYYAVCFGSRDMVRLLADAGADMNRPGGDGRLPLMASVGRGEPEVLALLLEHGAKIDARDGAGNTALHRAVVNGNLDVARLLIARGADVMARNRRGHTPLGALNSPDPVTALRPPDARKPNPYRAYVDERTKSALRTLLMSHGTRR